MRVRLLLGLIGIVCLLGGSTTAQASIIFDNFNADEGHFGYSASFSSTTNFTTASTADRVTTDAIEGAGSEKLVLVHSTATTNRLRFLSGAAPFNSATVTGAAHYNNNISFTVDSTPGVNDGFIGYYYKVIGTLANATGTTLSLMLDGPGGTTPEMDGATPKPINADGAWHLVEWSLDVAGDWGVITGIGGGGHGVLTGSHAIDSIYFQQNAAASGAQFQILVDFVAKSDGTASVATLLIPEPASIGFLLLGIPLVVKRRRR